MLNSNAIIYMTYDEIAKELAARPDRNDDYIQESVCRRHGVDLDSLPEDDCRLIKRLIRKYAKG